MEDNTSLHMVTVNSDSVTMNRIPGIPGANGLYIPDKTENPLDVQVGGGHYKSCNIQPVEYIEANGLGFFEGNILKYITRHASKNGRQDLEKARHYLDLLIKFRYGES